MLKRTSDFAEIGQASPDDFTRSMLEHYYATGSVRTADALHVLGDPAKSVNMSDPVSGLGNTNTSEK